jgi:DNA-binding transcriptional LysR family regulator
MKLHHLRDIVAIAERGSLRAAARHLSVAQPALTRSVRELERELGVALFERRTRGMILTPMGNAFMRRARSILGEMRRARDEVEQLHGGTRGKVVAGLSLAAHVALFPKALARFRTRYPQVQLHVIDGAYPTLEAGLKDGTVDFYVGPEPAALLPPDLSQEKLFDNTRVILSRIGHPLARARSLRALAQAEWATTSITFNAEEELNGVFKEHALPPPRLALHTQSALTLLIALASSDLLAMVPVQWTSFAAARGMLAPITVKETFRAPSIVIIRRADLPLTPAAEFFLDLLRRGAPRRARLAKT